MGIYLRYAAALIILATVSDSYAAVRKNVSMPSKSSVITNAERPFQTPNGSAGFFGQDFVDEHTAGNRFKPGDSPGSPKQKITLKPSVTANPSSVAKKAMQAVRGGGVPGLVASAVVTAAVAAAGAIIDSSGQIKVPGYTYEGMPVENPSFPTPPGYDFSNICQTPASQTLGKTFSITSGSSTYLVDVSYSPPAGFNIFNYCTSTSLGYEIDPATSTWPRASFKAISYSSLTSENRAPGDIEFDAMEQFMKGQGPAYVGDLIKETCANSPSPAACFDEMSEWGQLSGPSSATGPAQTTTSVTTNPDGTTSNTATTTQNKYNYTYGDNYYNYSTTTTTTTTKDGQTTTTETSDGLPTDEPTSEENPTEEDQSYTFDDSPMPDVPSFYEQKYPDGLSGVWDNASAQVNNSQFIQFLNGFVPSFSGSCPSFGLSFNIASWASYGSIGFSSLCYVFDFIKVILLVTALFTFRAITFGG